MKKTLFLLVTMLMFSLGSHAQADKIIGVYKTVRNGVTISTTPTALSSATTRTPMPASATPPPTRLSLSSQ